MPSHADAAHFDALGWKLIAEELRAERDALQVLYDESKDWQEVAAELRTERDALAARLDALEPLAREVAWRELEGTRDKYGWPDVFAVERLAYDDDVRAHVRAVLALLDTPRTPEAT